MVGANVSLGNVLVFEWVFESFIDASEFRGHPVIQYLWMYFEPGVGDYIFMLLAGRGLPEDIGGIKWMLDENFSLDIISPI